MKERAKYRVPRFTSLRFVLYSCVSQNKHPTPQSMGHVKGFRSEMQ